MTLGDDEQVADAAEPALAPEPINFDAATADMHEQDVSGPGPAGDDSPGDDVSELVGEPVEEATDPSEPSVRPLISGDPLLTGPVPVVGGRSVPSDDPDAGGESPSEPGSEPRVKPTPDVGPDLLVPFAPEVEQAPEPQVSIPVPPPPSAPVPPPPRAAPTGPIPVITPVPVAPIPAGQVPVAAPGAQPVTTAQRAVRATRPAGVPATATTRARPATRSGPPSGATPRIVSRRPRVRRVTRVVRHVDPWSVFKISAIFSFVAYGVTLVAGVLLWQVAYATGTIDNIERGMESTGWETFELNGGEIFHNAWIAGLFLAVGLVGVAVLAATVFNLVTDLVGGVRLTVLEEEVIEKAPRQPGKRASGRQPRQRPG